MLQPVSVYRGIPAALLEALLTLLAVLCLSGLARPLAAPAQVAGLHGRYAVAADTASPHASTGRAATDHQRQRARRAQTHAGHDITWLAGTGWLVLWLGRRRIARIAFAALAAAAWLSCATQIQAFGWDWDSARHGTVALLLLALPAGRIAPRPPSGQAGSSCWGYPGWVLLTGLGLLWLLDYAARGYPKHLFLGLKHADGLFMAYATLAVVAGVAPGIVSLLMRALAHLDSAALRAAPAAKASAMLLGIGWALAVALAVNEGNRLTAVVAEMLRVPVWLLLGWTCYRWVDTANKPARVLFGVFALTAVLMLGLAFNHGDKGQMLLFSLAAVFLASGWAGHQGGTLGLRGATLLGILLAIGGVAALVWLLFNVVPQWSETGAGRVAAVSAPFSTRLVFLAQIFWFLQEAPWAGYGLTHTPWCGYGGSLGGRCDGVPTQSHSDYALVVGVAGVWGPLFALAVCLACIFWLVSLLRPYSGGACALQGGRNTRLFAGWLLAMFVVSTLVQLGLTTLGSLGAIPLTGVPFPLLAIGNANLLVMALFTGLALNQLEEWPCPVPSTASNGLPS